jgi:hypothetical protein
MGPALGLEAEPAALKWEAMRRKSEVMLDHAAKPLRKLPGSSKRSPKWQETPIGDLQTIPQGWTSQTGDGQERLGKNTLFNGNNAHARAMLLSGPVVVRDEAVMENVQKVPNRCVFAGDTLKDLLYKRAWKGPHRSCQTQERDRELRLGSCVGLGDENLTELAGWERQVCQRSKAHALGAGVEAKANPVAIQKRFKKADRLVKFKSPGSGRQILDQRIGCSPASGAHRIHSS